MEVCKVLDTLEIVSSGKIEDSDLDGIKDFVGELTHYVMLQKGNDLIVVYCFIDNFNLLVG